MFLRAHRLGEQWAVSRGSPRNSRHNLTPFPGLEGAGRGSERLRILFSEVSGEGVPPTLFPLTHLCLRLLRCPRP